MIEFELNGQLRQLDIDADVPLLWALREELNMTGTKFGCGQGLCGACTVHIDGNAMRSCVTPVGIIAGRKITTIEGISANAENPVQQAWIEENVVQCGYCQPGQIMSACALLAQNPNPSDDDINAAMSGNICRCGTYPRIRKAIHRAAEIMAQPKPAAANASAVQSLEVVRHA
jgi:isoquinoline 1-oxidoreductase alpha subunit